MIAAGRAAECGARVVLIEKNPKLGKKLLITGVLSNRSIAYGIAKACHAQGAELAFSYVGERFKDRITEFAADFGSKLVFDCDVADDAQIDKLFIDDASKIPYSINGVVLTMPIESAIKALIQGGVSVPGCHIEKVDSFRSRG